MSYAEYTNSLSGPRFYPDFERHLADVDAMEADALNRANGDRLAALCILDAEWMGHDSVRADAEQSLRLALTPEQLAIWETYHRERAATESLATHVETKHMQHDTDWMARLDAALTDEPILSITRNAA